jgi:hypothetical protein
VAERYQQHQQRLQCEVLGPTPHSEMQRSTGNAVATTQLLHGTHCRQLGPPSLPKVWYVTVCMPAPC